MPDKTLGGFKIPPPPGNERRATGFTAWQIGAFAQRHRLECQASPEGAPNGTYAEGYAAALMDVERYVMLHFGEQIAEVQAHVAAGMPDDSKGGGGG